MIQHGKLNDRVYIMKLNQDDFSSVMSRTDELCHQNGYSKVFAKAPEALSRELIHKGYIKEAEIKNFYTGRENCYFLGRFLDSDRSRNDDKTLTDDFLKIAESKSEVVKVPELPENYTLKNLNEQNTGDMADLYRKVFNSYPFPIFDKDYLKQTMRKNIEYAGIFYKDVMVSIASAEKYPEYLNAEMTDFATLPEFTGNNFSVVLLRHLERKLSESQYKTLYTIARAKSAAMNITFEKSAVMNTPGPW